MTTKLPAVVFCELVTMGNFVAKLKVQSILSANQGYCNYLMLFVDSVGVFSQKVLFRKYIMTILNNSFTLKHLVLFLHFDGILVLHSYDFWAHI